MTAFDAKTAKKGSMWLTRGGEKYKFIAYEASAIEDRQAIFATYDAHKRVAEHHTPGGVLLEEDLRGLRKRVANIHGITPDDLKRWVELYHVEGLVDG